ncbi:MAG: class I SAM-dependent methyltransferase [Candidatus Auribacterota bacterium]
MNLFDKKNNRLIALAEEATPEFWDKRWETDELVKYITGSKHVNGTHDVRLKKYVDKYLTLGSRILEGGCGRGRYVYGFECWGYESYGVDYAEKTIEQIKEHFPDLKIFKQDVRRLEFADSFFDCYYSGGVIEHFWEGYDLIISEAYRVLKPGGYLIITMPFFSPLRQLKARLGKYSLFTASEKPDNFYQFFLNPKHTIKHIEELGFKKITAEPYNIILALKKEFPAFEKPLHAVLQGKTIFTRVLRDLMRLTLSWCGGHSILIVFRKNA